MITRVFFAPRRADLTTEKCLAHWRGTHANIGARLPNVRSYVQNHGVMADGRFLLPYPGFDIMPELEWDAIEQMDDAIDSPVHEHDSVDDEANFIDTSRTGYAVGARHALVDGTPPADAVKLITLYRRAPSASISALSTMLLGPYSMIVDETKPLKHEIVVTVPDREGRPPFAVQAIDIIWFKRPKDALAWTVSESANHAAWHLAGVACGTERLIARPQRVV